MNVILDIDETFLHHVGKNVWDAEGKISEEVENDTGGFEVEKDDEENAYFVLRPHYKKFFAFLIEKCETINIWTWNSRKYAEKVRSMMEKKIPGLKFANVWASEEADIANDEYGYHKPLEWLWNQGIFAPHNTLLIDDHPNLASAIDKKSNGRSHRVNSGNIRNIFNIPPFSPEDDAESYAYDDGLKLAMGEIDKILTTNNKRYCLRYVNFPKERKKGGKTKKNRTKTNRRKTYRG